MRVVHLSTYDIKGGAGRAAYRIHKGMCEQGLDSIMVVKEKHSNDNTVIQVPVNILEKLRMKLSHRFELRKLSKYKRKSDTLFTPGLGGLHRLTVLKKLKPDVVHIHWINGRYLNPSAIGNIPFPAIWTLSDTWAFTGGCHYTEACMHYLDHCGKCPVLNSSQFKDPSFFSHIRKSKVYQSVSLLEIATPSHWMQELASSSSLLKSYKVHWIANGLDAKLFKPYDKKEVRDLLKLPQNKLIILFGALWADEDPRKGWQLLLEAVKKIKTQNAILVIFGNSEKLEKPEIGLPLYLMGHIYDDELLAKLYACADVMVVPSLMEAFGQTASESLACGTPVVAFNSSGLKDIVDHLENGYLAETGNINELAMGIDHILSKGTKLERMRLKAREKALHTFDIEIITNHYIKAYEALIAKAKLAQK